MKRLIVSVFVIILALPVIARDQRGDGGDRGGRDSGQQQQSGQDNGNQGRDSNRGNQQQAQEQPVVINMEHPSSGWHNQNFPAAQPQQNAQSVQQGGQQKQQQPVSQQPSYGRLNWQSSGRQKNAPAAKMQTQSIKPVTQSKTAQKFPSAGAGATHIVHHRVSPLNNAKSTLQGLGVKSAPGYILNRADILNTDRGHSMINYPKTGANNSVLSAQQFSPRKLNNPSVRTQMGLVNSASWRGRVEGFGRNERDPRHYYWHHEHDFDFCHYIDDSGYGWYGWYMGSNFFWTRYFNSRWWWYDTDFDRWCFWNDGFWWWQDPYHMGDIYMYNNNNYVPGNSSGDQVAVNAPDTAGQHNFASPDGTRTVKVETETQDAYLYDTSKEPSFNPVYLASGVKDVQFSDTSSGRPLQIVLKLNDNSFDIFDGQGLPYAPVEQAPEKQEPYKPQ